MSCSSSKSSKTLPDMQGHAKVRKNNSTSRNIQRSHKMHRSCISSIQVNCKYCSHCRHNARELQIRDISPEFRNICQAKKATAILWTPDPSTDQAGTDSHRWLFDEHHGAGILKEVKRTTAAKAKPSKTHSWNQQAEAAAGVNSHALLRQNMKQEHRYAPVSVRQLE